MGLEMYHCCCSTALFVMVGIVHSLYRRIVQYCIRVNEISCIYLQVKKKLSVIVVCDCSVDSSFGRCNSSGRPLVGCF